MAMTIRANGAGITNLSHLTSQAREAAYAMGNIGRPDICASRMAPGLNLKRGPARPIRRDDRREVVLHERLIVVAQRARARYESTSRE